MPQGGTLFVDNIGKEIGTDEPILAPPVFLDPGLVLGDQILHIIVQRDHLTDELGIGDAGDSGIIEGRAGIGGKALGGDCDPAKGRQLLLCDILLGEDLIPFIGSDPLFFAFHDRLCEQAPHLLLYEQINLHAAHLDVLLHIEAEEPVEGGHLLLEAFPLGVVGAAACGHTDLVLAELVFFLFGKFSCKVLGEGP